MRPTDFNGEPPLDFRHARLGPSTCVKLGQNCIILGPKPAGFSQSESHGISETCSYGTRKAQVLVYAGPYLIAVLHPFLLSMSAICMKANTN